MRSHSVTFTLWPFYSEDSSIWYFTSSSCRIYNEERYYVQLESSEISEHLQERKSCVCSSRETVASAFDRSVNNIKSPFSERVRSLNNFVRKDYLLCLGRVSWLLKMLHRAASAGCLPSVLLWHWRLCVVRLFTRHYEKLLIIIIRKCCSFY